MITQIIFDMDQVLAETGELHYRALNFALEECGYYPIEYKDHVNTYSGLPTKIKLERLGIPDSDRIKINKLKQSITIELIESDLVIDEIKKSALFALHENGFKLACATNSITETTHKILKKIGIFEFLDVIVTNEMVVKAKPHPEIYLKCCELMKINPKESVVFEDAVPGIEAAIAANCNVVVVKSPKELTYSFIINNLLRF